MMILMETFLEENEKINDEFYREKQYNIIRLERESRYGGGIMIVVKNKLENIIIIIIILGLTPIFHASMGWTGYING